MTDRTTSNTTGDNLLMAYFERMALKTLHETVAFYRVAKKYPLPAQSGTTITFNAWRPIAAASSNLSEFHASANSAVALSSRKVTATLASYGRHVKITDLAELTQVLSPSNGAMQELTQSAALSLDNALQLAVYKNVLAQVGQNSSTKTALLSGWQGAPTSSFCANTGTTGQSRQFGFPVLFATSCSRLSSVGVASVSSRMGPIAVRKGVARLKKLSVPPFANGKYVGITHPNAIAAMFSNADYKQYIVNYSEGPRETMFKNKVSEVHNVEIVESPNSPRYATSAISALPLFICGPDALGVTEIGQGLEMIVKRSGPQTTSDPYNLMATVSYKLRVAAAALNPSAGVIVITHEAGV